MLKHRQCEVVLLLSTNKLSLKIFFVYRFCKYSNVSAMRFEEEVLYNIIVSFEELSL